MSKQVDVASELSDWPTFGIRHSFNPEDVAENYTFEPNEVVLYDAKDYEDGRWISAKYGSYQPITQLR